MNYYDDTLNRIKEYIDSKDYLSAKAIILEEFKQIYIPKEFEQSLKEYLQIINENLNVYKSYSIEEIESFLYMDNDHQLIAVDYLDKLNLRDHINICDNYLKDGDFKNAQVLLIDSLIRQQIDHNFTYLDGVNTHYFNPIELKNIEETDGYICAYKVLDDYYMKEPSKFVMAKQLLNKEMLMNLPKMYSGDEGKEIADKIIKFIDDAFNSAN